MNEFKLIGIGALIILLVALTFTDGKTQHFKPSGYSPPSYERNTEIDYETEKEKSNREWLDEVMQYDFESNY